MRRLNIQAAFIGEPDPTAEGMGAAESDEAVVLQVRGGEVVAQVPQGTPDAEAIARATWLRGTLELEHERVLLFEIYSDATGAFFEDESLAAYRRRREHGGLSTVGSAEAEAAAPVAAESPPKVGSALARDVMTTTVVTARPDMPLRELAGLLSYHRVSGMPVCSETGELVGIVTEHDVLAHPQADLVGEVMTRAVISVAETTPLEEVARLLTQRGIKRVPVLRAGQLVGIISRADLVRALAAR